MRDAGDGVLRFLVYGVVALGALGLAWVARKIAFASTVGGPLRLLERARDMRRRGASLDACGADLRAQGVRAGVARSLVLDMEREQPADVANPREGAWGGYRFRYPGNWRIETVVPGIAIAVEGVGSGMVVVTLHGELEDVLREQEPQIRDPERTRFDAWGAFRGDGVRLRGVHGRMRVPMELAVFEPAEADPPFVVLEMHALEEAHLVLPGLALVRDSFA